MVLGADVRDILAHIDAVGLEPEPVAPGWQHMGAVLSDAALQAGINYRITVYPRVKKLVETWPDATSTSAFFTRMTEGDIAAVLEWEPDSKKMRTLRDLTNVLLTQDVETVEQLSESLLVADFRKQLRGVKGVGPKTIDYLSILTGSTDHAAIDVHLRRFIRDAGVEVDSYRSATEILRAVAKERDWGLRALDAAIWQYKSNGG